jgi:hypothetical protein
MMKKIINEDISKKDNATEYNEGYPLYPSNEDITNRMEKVDVDVENLSRSADVDNENTIRKNNLSTQNENIEPDSENDLEIVEGTEADVTTEDLKILGDKDRDQDMGEDEEASRVLHSDDLDVPGSELDDESEMIGNEDEENNFYSIGGDDKSDLEEGRNEEIL